MLTMRSHRPPIGVAAAAVVLLAGCASSSAGASASPTAADTGTGALAFAVFNPFSGSDAAFGPEQLAGCAPAVKALMAAGGVLDHKTITCGQSDSRGDPADAVPAAQKLMATTSGLVGVMGPSSDEASATAPLFDRGFVPMFADTGQVVFNTNTLKYFYRITPPDDAVGYAMALYAHDKGYTRVAAVFGADISSQGGAPTAVSGTTHLGGQVVINQKLQLDQTSYRTEVEQLIAAHPQVILTEADAQTSATYLSELQQLSGLIPIVGSGGTTQPDWQKAVSKSLGASAFGQYYVGAQPYAPSSGPAFDAWQAGLQADASGVEAPVAQWVNDPYSMAAWDSVNIIALAIEMAKSSDPKVFNADISKVANAGAGAVVVHDFATGKAAILAGKTIQYVGATGPVALDRYNNSPGGFEIVSASGAALGVYTSAQLATAHP
jgi:ABC-type branched-subunit amino acid transport system substrate-binding protein